MTDPLDFIAARLKDRPLTTEAVEAAIAETRQHFGGDIVYVRKPLRTNVSKRTEQRRLKAGKP